MSSGHELVGAGWACKKTSDRQGSTGHESGRRRHIFEGSLSPHWIAADGLLVVAGGHGLARLKPSPTLKFSPGEDLRVTPFPDARPVMAWVTRDNK